MAGKKGPRKLLVASVGVATMNYVLAGCDGMTSTSANLVAGPIGGSFNQAGTGGSVNLAGATVANLVAPPPMGGNVSTGGSASMGGTVPQAGNAGTEAGGVGGVGGAGEGGESNTAGQDGAGQGGDDAGGAGGAP
ncbi:MAG TPA: hypothetical protein VEX18_01830 [Polyangiaceae bacterium]|nr:hypothetical protein [Polyangiaceae bacterium]